LESTRLSEGRFNSSFYWGGLKVIKGIAYTIDWKGISSIFSAGLELSWVSCCDVRIQPMFGSSLPPVVCKRSSCLIYVICVCLRIVVSNTYCVVFLFCFSSSCVPYIASFLDCLFLITPSVFSNVFIGRKRQWHISILRP